MTANDATRTVENRRPLTGCRLVVLSGDLAGFTVDVPDNDSVTIGRAEQADATLPVDGLSRMHARLQSTPAGVVVLDLESRNGTFVNEERVAQRVLVDGDRVRLGALEFMFYEA
jgi:pSer/pThr/pTyr-binding forkhead associated (FHA) protein